MLLPLYGSPRASTSFRTPTADTRNARSLSPRTCVASVSDELGKRREQTLHAHGRLCTYCLGHQRCASGIIPGASVSRLVPRASPPTTFTSSTSRTLARAVVHLTILAPAPAHFSARMRDRHRPFVPRTHRSSRARTHSRRVAVPNARANDARKYASRTFTTLRDDRRREHHLTSRHARVAGQSRDRPHPFVPRDVVRSRASIDARERARASERASERIDRSGRAP